MNTDTTKAKPIASPLSDFIERLLDPEDLGHAVTAEVRELAGRALREGK